jgi:fimbrial chaperone protein
MQMKEDGIVVPLPPGQTDPYSAIPYVHMAPKSMTLKPGESQNVRILLRKPEGLAPGEYRSHLKVRLANDDVEGTQPADEKAVAPAGTGKKETSIAIKAHLVLVIPVIFRHGDTTYTMKIDSPKVVTKEGHAKLELYLVRDGNRSSMGDITVNYIPPGGGAARTIASFPGVPVYRPTPRRFVSVPLEIPAGVSLSAGTLDITYKAQEKEGGKLLAEEKLPLGG